MALLFRLKSPPLFHSTHNTIPIPIHGYCLAKNKSDLPAALQVRIGKKTIPCSITYSHQPNQPHPHKVSFQASIYLRKGIKLLQFTSTDASNRTHLHTCRLIHVQHDPLYTIPSLIPTKHRTPGINLFGFFDYVHGIAQGARLTAQTLQLHSIPHTLSRIPLPQNCEKLNPPFPLPPTKSLHHTINLFHCNAPEFHAIRKYWPRLLKANYRTIGYWAWELEDLPQRWSQELTHLDEIWCPTTFVRDAIARAANKLGLSLPILVIPHPIFDPHPHPSSLPPPIDLPQKKFLILTTFDLNSTLERKNPFATIQAFRRALNKIPHLHLIIKTHHTQQQPHLHQQLLHAIADLKHHISLITQPLSPQNLLALQSHVHAFISLHRSEGFGLNLAEMMLLGKPVIATNWSGNTDFLDADCGCPISYTLKPLTPDCPYQTITHGRWAEADTDHAAHAIIRLAEDPDYARQIGQNARQKILTLYSPQVIADKIKARILDLA
ncbi:MAG: glycosyltransferase family 4 protein [Verrucomicrobiae bacterium]|nr:glycosyltransferase family 4 protein [Verrucomicrobiae bacterium]